MTAYKVTYENVDGDIQGVVYYRRELVYATQYYRNDRVGRAAAKAEVKRWFARFNECLY